MGNVAFIGYKPGYTANYIVTKTGIQNVFGGTNYQWNFDDKKVLAAYLELTFRQKGSGS